MHQSASAIVSARGDDISYPRDIHRLNIFAVPTDNGYPAGKVKNGIYAGEGTPQRLHVQDVTIDSLHGKALEATCVLVHEGSNGPSTGEKCPDQIHSQVARGAGDAGKHTAR